MLYYLNGKDVVKTKNVFEWSEKFNCCNKIVKQTDILDVFISTVFLGVDYNCFGGKPLLFETMVIEEGKPRFQERYSTWDEAEKGHEKICELLIAKLN